MYTKYVTADSVVRLRCMQMGDNHMHRWGDNYLLLMEGVSELVKSSVPIRGMQTRLLPMDSGRVWLPGGISSVCRVGVVVEGHFQPMMMDNNMIDQPGECGGLSENLPTNPDIPALRTVGQLPTLYTGSITGAAWPWLWTGPGGWPVSGSGSGVPGWPGAGGFYRLFPAEGYILFDRTSAESFAHVAVEVLADPMEDGVVTWVPDLCTGYLLAWMKYRLISLAAETDTKERPLVQSAYSLWCAERIKLNNRQCMPPPADLWAAVCLMT